MTENVLGIYEVNENDIVGDSVLKSNLRDIDFEKIPGRFEPNMTENDWEKIYVRCRHYNSQYKIMTVEAGDDNVDADAETQESPVNESTFSSLGGRLAVVHPTLRGRERWFIEYESQIGITPSLF